MPGQAINEALRSSTRKGYGSRKHLCFSNRAPFLQREKAAYIKLRRVGLSINQIAKAFGRSTSVIHRALKRVLSYKTLRRFDMRKLPRRARMLSASFRWSKMLKLLPAWEIWISGEGEKPP
jgi:hypothetical protein